LGTSLIEAWGIALLPAPGPAKCRKPGSSRPGLRMATQQGSMGAVPGLLDPVGVLWGSPRIATSSASVRVSCPRHADWASLQVTAILAKDGNRPNETAGSRSLMHGIMGKI
jgi:hypothetical protein